MGHPEPMTSGRSSRVVILRAMAALMILVAVPMSVGCDRSETGGIVATWPFAESERPAATTAPAASYEASVGAEVPSNDPAQKRKDKQGRLPEEVLIQLIESINEGEWRTAYDSYAHPEVDFKTFTAERSKAQEVYSDFTILETRVTATDTATARVTYALSSESGRSARDVVITAPGEWWGMSLIDGVWKVNWLPRQ